MPLWYTELQEQINRKLAYLNSNFLFTHYPLFAMPSKELGSPKQLYTVNYNQ